jgi:hypothetical protein
MSWVGGVGLDGLEEPETNVLRAAGSASSVTATRAELSVRRAHDLNYKVGLTIAAAVSDMQASA